MNFLGLPLISIWKDSQSNNFLVNTLKKSVFDAKIFKINQIMYSFQLKVIEIEQF